MKVKIVFVAILLCLLLPCLAACGNNKDVFDKYANQGYTCRVTYDFGNGLVDGKNSILCLFAPESPLPEPGTTTQSIPAPVLAGQHVTGYYVKDDSGNERDWNFATDRVTGDFTIYARWSPDYAVKVLYGDNLELSYSLPVSGDEALNSLRQANWAGHTFYAFYEDAEFTKPLTFPYTPAVNAENPTVTVYARYLEGAYTVVRRASDFSKAIKAGTNYYIDADIDLTGVTVNVAEIFSGRIIGNGHTIKGLQVTRRQTKTSENYGLFGSIGGKAVLENITFEDVGVTVLLNNDSNPNINNSCIGVLAGSVDAGATFTNVKINGSLIYYCYDKAPTLSNVGDLFGYVDPTVDISSIDANVTVTEVAGAPASE